MSSSGGTRTHSIPGSKPRWSANCLPSRSAQNGSRTRKRSGLSRAALPRWRTWARVVPDGIEPSFPGCRPGVVAVGPRDRVSQVESPGVAPGSPACGADIVLLDHDPDVFLSGSRGARTHKRQTCRRLLSKQVPQPFGWLPLLRPRRRKPWDSNPQTAICRHLFSRQAPHPGRMASVVELRGLESNQHEDVQSVSSCRWMTPQ